MERKKKVCTELRPAPLNAGLFLDCPHPGTSAALFNQFNHGRDLTMAETLSLPTVDHKPVDGEESKDALDGILHSHHVEHCTYLS